MATLASNHRVNEKRETITIDYDRFLCLRAIAHRADVINRTFPTPVNTTLNKLLKDLQKLEVSAMIGKWNQ